MAPKRAFGGVLRSFGGGFRGPNRERASVFSSAGRGAERGSSAVQEGRGRGRLRCGTGGPTCSAVEPGAGPARSAARDRAVQVVLRWSPEAEPACSAAQDGGGAGGSAVEPGRGQRVQRWGPVRDGGGTGGGSAAQAGAGPACSAARDGGGTGSSEVQTGRAAPPGRKKVFRREDAPAARTQKKCSEGKVRRRPNTYGHKKNGPRSVHFYFCYTTLLLYGLLLRDARPIHPAARQRLRTPGARLFCGRLPAACSPATACLPSISVCPSVGVTAVKASAIRSLSRPPVGAQPPGRRNLSRPGSPP